MSAIGSTYNRIIAGSVVGLGVHEMILDENVLSRDAPAPSNGLDDLDVLDKTIGDIEGGQMRAKGLCEDVDNKPLVSEKCTTYTNAFVPPLLTEAVESTKLASLCSDELDVGTLDVKPGGAVDCGNVGGLVYLNLNSLNVIGQEDVSVKLNFYVVW